MKKISLFNCFDCHNGFLLIEMTMNVKAKKIKFDTFTVEHKGDDGSPDRKMYALQFLDLAGCERIRDLYTTPNSMKPCRFAFFLVKKFADIFKTPYGAYDLRDPDPIPERLINCLEFIGMADKDKYNYYYDQDLEDDDEDI